MVRRVGLLVICACVLAGTALAATRDPRDPQKKHNAADQAWAERIRVQRSDLGAGDWRVEASGDDDDRGAPRECKKPDLSDLVETGSAEEPDFSRNASFVGSGSIVFRTERELAIAWKRLTRTPYTKCFIWAFNKGAAGSGARARVVSSGPIKMAKLAPRFITGRMNVVLSGPNASIRGRISYYFAARGRASVMLLVASFGRPATPIAEALERRLATLVASRLKK